MSTVHTVLSAPTAGAVPPVPHTAGGALVIDGLNAWYGRAHVVQDVGFAVAPGEAVALLGRNGAGKTSTLRAIMGLMPRMSGTISYAGCPLHRAPAHARFHRGLAYVPEDRRIVPGLTVRENIRLGLIASRERRDEETVIADIARTFPRLRERLDQMGTSMSGGEQQMLSIARAVAAGPSLVLLDEPSEGVSPLLVDEMYELFAGMKAAGTTLLLVEQEVERALEIADRVCVLDQGRLVHVTSVDDFRTDAAAQARWCAL
jgi:branched-chain amino acid transport system ATP-binding protein